MTQLPARFLVGLVLGLGLCAAGALACAAPGAPGGQPAGPTATLVEAPRATDSVSVPMRERRRISVAYPTNVVTMTGFYIALQEGYTAEEGVEAEMVRMNGTLSAQGIVAKQVDFGMSAGALLAASLRGAPIRNVFVQMDKPLFYLFVQPDIAAAVDLEGKPVGIAAVGDSTHLAVKAALRGLGADPERVSYAANLTGSQAVTALQSGAVSGATVSPPNDSMALRLGFRKLAFMGDYLDYLTSGLATHEETIQSQPDLVLAVVR